MPNPSESIDEMVASFPDWRGGLLAKLRRIVHDADPEITEEVKWRRPSNPMGAPVFEHDGIVCIIGVLKERVRITMNDGASLPDPKGLYNAMLKGKSRAIDFYEGDKLDESAIKALVRAGVEQNVAKAMQRRKPSSPPAQGRG